MFFRTSVHHPWDASPQNLVFLFEIFDILCQLAIGR